MTSWVYVFAKFTPEALLFEALLISILVASYAAFWVLHKRKFGALHSGVPTGVVKDYLNELIVDAERMRAQLFGILAGRDLPVSAMNPGTDYAHTAASLNFSDDPAMAKKLLLLEAKMAEQSMAMDRLIAQKTEMEVALAAAKSAPPATGSTAAPVNTAATAELENKIKNLESKLAEYSVIEDDLANLKRLQQENAQLRAQLNGKGTISPTAEPSITSSPAPAPTPAPRELTSAKFSSSSGFKAGTRCRNRSRAGSCPGGSRARSRTGVRTGSDAPSPGRHRRLFRYRYVVRGRGGSDGRGTEKGCSRGFDFRRSRGSSRKEPRENSRASSRSRPDSREACTGSRTRRRFGQANLSGESRSADRTTLDFQNTSG